MSKVQDPWFVLQLHNIGLISDKKALELIDIDNHLAILDFPLYMCMLDHKLINEDRVMKFVELNKNNLSKNQYLQLYEEKFISKEELLKAVGIE